jgi:hypothetical protein
LRGFAECSICIPKADNDIGIEGRNHFSFFIRRATHAASD